MAYPLTGDDLSDFKPLESAQPPIPVSNAASKSVDDLSDLKPIDDLSDFKPLDSEPPAAMRDVARGTAGALQRYYGFGELGAKLLGSEEGQKYYRGRAEEYADIAKNIPSSAPSFQEVISDPSLSNVGAFTRKAVFENLPNIAIGGAAGVGAKALGASGALALKIGTVVPAGIQEAGGIYQGIREETGVEAPLTALATGAVSGWLESLVPKRLLGKLFEATEGEAKKLAWREIVGKAAKEAAKSGAEEFATESAQEMVSIAANKFADSTYDAVNPKNAMRVLEAGIAGMLAGGVTGGATEVAAQGLRNSIVPAANADAETTAIANAVKPAEPQASFTAPNSSPLDEKPIAPAVYAGKYEATDYTPELHIFNLTEAIPGHPVNSTVSGQTLEKAGFRLPPLVQPNQSYATQQIQDQGGVQIQRAGVNEVGTVAATGVSDSLQPTAEAATQTQSPLNPAFTVYHGGPANALESNWPKWFTTSESRANAYGAGNVFRATVSPKNPLVSKVTLSPESVERAFSNGHDAIIIGSLENPIDIIIPGTKDGTIDVSKFSTPPTPQVEATPIAVPIIPLQSATGIEQIRTLINNPEAHLPKETIDFVNHLLENPVFSRLDAGGLALSIGNQVAPLAEGQVAPAGVSAIRSPLAGLIQIGRNAEPTVAVHEFFHSLEGLLGSGDRSLISALRNNAIAAEYAKAANPQTREALAKLQSGQVTSREFGNLKFPQSIYHLANDSEFFAHLMSNNFKADFEQANSPATKSFIASVKSIIKAIADWFSRQTGLGRNSDRVYRDLLAGNYKLNPQSGQLYEWRSGGNEQASFVTTGDEAANAKILAKDKVLESKSQLAQSVDILDSIAKHGGAALSNEAKTLLDAFNYNDISESGKFGNKGVREGYRAIKAQLASNPYDFAWIHRPAAIQMVKFTQAMERLIRERDLLAKKVASKGNLKMFAREQAAQVKRKSADQLLLETQSILNAAISKANRELERESKNDLDIARLEGEIRGLEEAKASSAAMRQLIHDMVDRLSTDPSGAGMQMLFDPSANPKKIAAEYTKNPDARYKDSNLINWASYVLAKDAELRDYIIAQGFANDAKIKDDMTDFESSFLEAYEADPLKALKAAFKTQAKLVTNKERARFAWLTLHKKTLEILDNFSAYDDAADVGAAILKDPEFKALRAEILRDAQVEGTQAPAGIEDVVILPDGSQVDVGKSYQIYGNKQQWESQRAKLQSQVAYLQQWVDDVETNGEDINYRIHERDLEFLKNYYMTSAMNSPADSKRLFTSNLSAFDILWNAIELVGGRVSQLVKPLIRNWEKTGDRASRWNDKWSNILSVSRTHAIESHNFNKGFTKVEANKQWYQKVGQELAASHAQLGGGLGVGDLLSSGERVTTADMADLKLMADATSAGFAIVDDADKASESAGRGLPGFRVQLTKDTLGRIIIYRRAIKGSQFMVPRLFTADNKIKNFVQNFIFLRDAIAKEANEDEKASLTDKLNELLSRDFEVVQSLIKDRNPEFAKVTPFDGDEGAFKLVSDGIADKSLTVPLANRMQWLENTLSQYSGMTTSEVREVLLHEWDRIIRGYKNETDSESDVSTVPRAQESKNAFSRSRNNAMAPWVFYDYGFKDTPSLLGFGSSIASHSLDDLIGGLRRVVADIDRQIGSFDDEQKSLPKAEILKAQDEARRNGETYDRYEHLVERRKLMERFIDNLTNQMVEFDALNTARRASSAVVQSLLISTPTTARNVTTGPVYLGQFLRQLNASNLQAYPSAFWYSAVKNQAKWLAAVAYRAGRGFTYDLATGTYKAIRNAAALEKERKFNRVFSTMFGDTLQQIGHQLYRDIETYKKMEERGLIYVHDRVKELDSRLTAGMMTQGQIASDDLPLFKKALFGPLGLYETFVLGIAGAPLNPAWGDAALNTGTAEALTSPAAFMGSSAGIFQMHERNLQRIWLAYKESGYRKFDFSNPSSPVNALSYKEVFPVGVKNLRFKSTASDLVDLEKLFTRAGFPFQEKAIEYMAKLEAGDKTAQFMTDDERDNFIDAALNYVNKSSRANVPQWTRSSGVLQQLVAPFMSWRFRMAGNFVNSLSIAERDPDMRRAVAWAIVAMTLVLPMMFFNGLIGAGAEEEDRAMKKFLYNSIKSSRQPWEREPGLDQAKGWAITTLTTVPALDWAVNFMLNDTPAMGRLDPSLVLVEKMKDIARYAGGVIQTGDATYGLTRLVTGMFPDSKILLNQLDANSGTVEARNVAALARRYGDTELLRTPGSGSSVGMNVNPLTPYADKMVNAALRGDMEELRQVYEAGVAKATEMGRKDPERLMAQLYESRNPIDNAFKVKLSEPQYNALLAKMSPGDRAAFIDSAAKFQAGASAIGSRATFFKQEKGGGGGFGGIGYLPLGGGIRQSGGGGSYGGGMRSPSIRSRSRRSLGRSRVRSLLSGRRRSGLRRRKFGLSKRRRLSIKRG